MATGAIMIRIPRKPIYWLNCMAHEYAQSLGWYPSGDGWYKHGYMRVTPTVTPSLWAFWGNLGYWRWVWRRLWA